jgi:hypothetical protein
MFVQLRPSNETASFRAIKTATTKVLGFNGTGHVASNKSKVYDENKVKNRFQLKSYGFSSNLFAFF